MSMSEVEVETPIIDVTFSRDGSSMAVLHRSGVSLFGLETKGTRLCAPKVQSEAHFGKSVARSYDEPLLQIAFSGNSEVQILHMVDDLELLRHDFASPGEETKVWRKTDAASIVMITTPGPALDDGIVAQDFQGRLSRVCGGEHFPYPSEFPSFMPWASFIKHADHYLAIGLTRNGHLYANSRQLAKNCTSFVVTEHHLIYTTTNHLVKFIHLAVADEGMMIQTISLPFPGATADNPKDLNIPQDDPENDERCRSIERGGRLVTAMPTKMGLVLQMPRGNLETIYPRAMVLAGIRQFVEQKDYNSAFATCRTQRVDMNLLYDHRPGQFLENIGLFLEQVNDTANIDLFLSGLKYVQQSCITR